MPGAIPPSRRWPGSSTPSRRSGSATGSSRTVRSGTSPAHTSRSPSGPSPSSGGPSLDLDRRLVQTEPEHGGGGQLLVRREPGVLPLPGGHVVADGPEAGQLLRPVGDHLGDSEDHGAAVVDRVVEDRSGQHHPVDQGHRHAHRRGSSGRPQAATGRRAVQEHGVSRPPVGGRDDHGSAVHLDAQMADEPGIEHGEEVLPPVRALLGQAPKPGPLGRRLVSVRGGVGHSPESATEPVVAGRSGADKRERRRAVRPQGEQPGQGSEGT